MKKLVVFTMFAMLFSFVPMASATGINVSANGSTYGAELALATTTTVTFTWTSSAAASYQVGDTIVFVVKDNTASRNTYTAVAMADSAVPDVNADTDGNNDGSFTSFASGVATYTIATPANVTTTSMSLNFDMAFPAAGIYSVNVGDNRNSDHGAVLIYVDDDNDVLIRAEVAPELSFAIRTYTDEQNLGDDNEATPSVAASNEVDNICDLGTLSLTAMSTCTYRLKVYTSASSGYTVQIATDGDLGKNGPGAQADIDDLDPGSVITGSTTESYGIYFDSGSATGATTCAAAGNWADTAENALTDTALAGGNPVVAATPLYTCTGPNAPLNVDTTNTALVDHRVVIDAGTATSFYEQTITYTAAASF